MNIKELLRKNRSYRRFIEAKGIDSAVLKELVASVQLAPSPANIQPLKFIIINEKGMNGKIFIHLKWAAYLSDWHGPKEGERPSAYIIMLGDRKKSRYIDWDYGIALQTILLSAAAKGLGGCAIAACNRPELINILNIPKEFELAIVIALGIPGETVVIEEAIEGQIKYWRDGDGVHHVPKRPLTDLIYKIIE